jgi:hypothetical protein
VRLLGDLRAREAVDALVTRLHLTGDCGVVFSISYRPVARAVQKIGEPAIPRLIEALSERRSTIFVLAASTLAEIGQPAVARLRETLRGGEAPRGRARRWHSDGLEVVR